jgi:hypothetical protein
MSLIDSRVFLVVHHQQPGAARQARQRLAGDGVLGRLEGASIQKVLPWPRATPPTLPPISRPGGG